MLEANLYDPFCGDSKYAVGFSVACRNHEVEPRPLPKRISFGCFFFCGCGWPLTMAERAKALDVRCYVHVSRWVRIPCSSAPLFGFSVAGEAKYTPKACEHNSCSRLSVHAAGHLSSEMTCLCSGLPFPERNRHWILAKIILLF